jgi:LacI family transcriptional regulator
VLSGRIDGLIVASARPGHPIPGLLVEHRVPHVFLNRAVPGSGRNVVMDDPLGARLALDHLAGLGHHRIAHIRGPSGVEPAGRRAGAFRARAEELGLPPVRVVEADFLERGGADALDRLLAADDPPTAVYTDTVSQAAGALHTAWRRRIRVPERLSVLAHAEMPLAEMLVPSVTTVEMPLEEVGAAAVDALLAQISTGTTADVLVATRPSIVARSSTGPAPRDRDLRLATSM